MGRHETPFVVRSEFLEKPADPAERASRALPDPDGRSDDRCPGPWYPRLRLGRGGDEEIRAALSPSLSPRRTPAAAPPGVHDPRSTIRAPGFAVQDPRFQDPPFQEPRFRVSGSGSMARWRGPAVGRRRAGAEGGARPSGGGPPSADERCETASADAGRGAPRVALRSAARWGDAGVRFVRSA